MVYYVSIMFTKLTLCIILHYLICVLSRRAAIEDQLIISLDSAEFCQNQVEDPTLPNCRVSFREDAGWMNQFNGTCLKPHVFQIPFDRPSKNKITVGRNNGQGYGPELPPYVRFSCTAPYPLDFDFGGNGGMEYFRVWKNVKYVNGTATMESQTLNVELVMSPDATGNFYFYSIDTPSKVTSYFIFSERPEPPFLVNGGESRVLQGKLSLDRNKVVLPCVLSNPNVTVQLYTQSDNNTWKLWDSHEDNHHNFIYEPETGFILSPYDIHDKQMFQCRAGDTPNGDTVNVQIALTLDTSLSNKRLKIQFKENGGAVCFGSPSDVPLRIYNIYVRNPTESHIIADCFLKGQRNCGGHSYHARIEGTLVDGTVCPKVNNTRTCSAVAIIRLHKEGLIICTRGNESATLEYFTGFDGKIYTDPTLAQPSSILQVQLSTTVVSIINAATGLVTGIKYEVKCASVEFPFVKESQLLYVKYRNGTKELLADLVWWKSGKELFVNPDMTELECSDRLWRTNDFYNSTAFINVTSRACNSDQYRCNSGQCIRDIWRCDGDKDCLDGSDEEACNFHVCREGYFKCLGGQCVGEEKRCNNKRDCPDASDESFETCSNTTCSPQEFKCSSGQCILAHFLCDTDLDCFDNSDESRENCARYFPTISSTNQSITLREGLPGELICEVDPLPAKLKPRMEWWRNDANVTDSSRLWRNIDESKLSLRFPVVTEVDAGDYVCFAQNMLSRVSVTFHLIVVTQEEEKHGETPSGLFPCHHNLSNKECITEICTIRPDLEFCLHLEFEDFKNYSASTNQIHMTKPKISEVPGPNLLVAWIIVGVCLILLSVMLATILVSKLYFSNNAHVPCGSVRMRQDDEVLILSGTA